MHQIFYMKKSRKYIKLLLSLFLVVIILGINSFASVVSDNDGSAFVTKAEFEGLKKNFNSQVTQYNASIDAKIDGAIGSYLAGIDLKKKKELTSILNQAGQRFISSNNCGFVTTRKGTYSKYFMNIGVCTGGAANTCRITQLQYLTGTINAPSWDTANSTNYGIFWYGTKTNSGNYKVKRYTNSYPFAAVAGVFTAGGNEGTTTSFSIPNKTFTCGSADSFQAGDDSWSITVGRAYTVNVVKTFGVQDTYYDINQNYLTGYALATDNQYFVAAEDVNKPGTEYWDYKADWYGYEIQAAGIGWGSWSNPSWTKLRVYNHYYSTINRLSIINEKITGLMNQDVFYYNGCPIFQIDDKPGKVKLELHVVNSGNYPTVFQIKKEKFDNTTISETGAKTSDYKWDDVIKVNSTSTGVDVELEIDVKKDEIYWIKARPIYTPSGTITEFTYPSIITTKKIEFEEE